MARHPVLRPGDTLRLRGETHTVAGLDSATVRLTDVTGAVREVPTAGLRGPLGYLVHVACGRDARADVDELADARVLCEESHRPAGKPRWLALQAAGIRGSRISIRERSTRSVARLRVPSGQ
jgi:hypothetical protein